MPYWDMLGRTLIAKVNEETASRITQYLTYSGLDATISSLEETGLFAITVPAEQANTAEKLLDIMQQNEMKDDDRAEYYRANFLERSPSFIPSEEKFRYSTNSSIAYLCAGAIVLLMALIHFFLVIFRIKTGPIIDCLVELILGSIFMIFGLTTHQKVRFLESSIQEENSFTNQIVRWCTTFYPAEHLDKCIDAASDNQHISDEDRFFLRRELIQDYILREYDISDEAYLDYLTDLIYKKLYYPNAVSAC
ncbi:MAG: hypothetical protein PUB22_05185 [Clostridiales bacterium]|nr:hypothetical protein [Clostridiales bacterium]